MSDKILLRKHSIIETVNNELKNICQIQHYRHCSIENFMISGREIIAHHFLPKKTSLKYESLKTSQLAMFY